MGQKKGMTGNPNGRPVGSPNKVTAIQRAWIEDFLSKNRKLAEKDWLELTPSERWKMFEKLLGYIIPRMQSVNATIDFSKMSDDDLNMVINKLIEEQKHENQD